MSYNQKKTQLMSECDKAANDYWNLPLEKRDEGYELWMKKVKKVSEFIDVYKKKDSNVDL